MRIAIIGATGNAGTALLRRLRLARTEQDEVLDIVGVARRLPAQNTEPYDGVEWHSIDVGADDARARLAAAFAGCDAVVHLAWVLQPNRDEALMHRINVGGTAAVLGAVEDAGVGQLVCASSLGAYSPAPQKPTVDESWPARGISTSHYSRFKGEQEALLDSFAVDHPGVVVARLRPGLIFQQNAGAEIGRYFLGPLVPKFFVNHLRVPLLPIPDAFVFQVVHADDVADAYWRVLQQHASGAFNIAADPVITPALLGGILGARRILNVPVRALRALVGVAWGLNAVAADPGWVDMAQNAPVMDTGRARRELGWRPRFSSVEALQIILDGLSARAGSPASPPLSPAKRRAAA